MNKSIHQGLPIFIQSSFGWMVLEHTDLFGSDHSITYKCMCVECTTVCGAIIIKSHTHTHMHARTHAHTRTRYCAVYLSSPYHSTKLIRTVKGGGFKCVFYTTPNKLASSGISVQVGGLELTHGMSFEVMT